MNRSIVLTTVVALFAGALGSLAMDAVTSGAGTARSASEDASILSVQPAIEADDLIQGDVDCDGDVDAVDGLGVLVNVAALEALAQQEPCTDVADIIPAGEGVPGPQGPPGPQGEPGVQGPPGISSYELVTETTEGSCETECVFLTTVTCPLGKKILGGGSWFAATDGQFKNYGSRPLTVDTWGSQWYVSGASFYEFSDAAICANVAE